MESEIRIKDGEVDINVLDGQGEECRQKGESRLRMLREKYGLPLDEDCKPEMENPTPLIDTLEDEQTL